MPPAYPRKVAREVAERLLLAKAVKQNRLGSPYGNCLEACYATLLGVPLRAVPDPRIHAVDTDDAEELLAERIPILRKWLHDQFTLCAVGDEGESPPGVLLRTKDVPLFWIASGPSERGLQHACVYSNADLLFDPHPSDTGLLEVTHWTVLVPLGPLWDRVVPASILTKRKSA
jgi:hypothetical protein